MKVTGVALNQLSPSCCLLSKRDSAIERNPAACTGQRIREVSLKLIVLQSSLLKNLQMSILLWMNH